MLVSTWVNNYTVYLVVVNASGRSVEISWQPAPSAAPAAVTLGGCASNSPSVSRGASWIVTRDGEAVLDSSSAGLPLFGPPVAVEVWLDPDGSVKVAAPHTISRLIDAPYPNCQNASRRPAG